MIIFCYQLRHIRKGKDSLSKYVDAADPMLDRYAALKQEIREKSSEQKSLRSEKKNTPAYHLKRHMELSQRITKRTEDLEELRSEQTMILNSLGCADDPAVKKVKTSVSTMKDTLKNLEAQEERFTAELDAAQKEIVVLQERAADFDPVVLYDARQTIRPEKEQNAVRRLQDAYGDKYNAMLMIDSKRDVANLLHEEAETRSVRKTLWPKQQEKAQQQGKQKHYEQER